jgi:peptide/nickel transport system permease protein
MVVLWTDALIFVLIIVICLLAIYLRNKEHIKRPLQKIGASKVGVASLVVLIFFVLIGLVDSLHFKPTEGKSTEVMSCLDFWAKPLIEHVEKTYSAPFATTLYSKELMVLEDGTTKWGYPRLVYGGSHLLNPESDLIPDVSKKVFYSLSQGIAFGSLPILLYLSIRYKRQSKSVQFVVISSSARTILFAIFVIISLGYTLVYLSSYYHIFGTDKVGEDVFYQVVKSVRTGLVLGTLTTLIMLPLAIAFGILAGFFQGWLDDVIQYLYTTLNSIPGVLLIAASILMVQVYIANHEQSFTSVIVRADMRLLFLCLILGVTNWTGLCRLLRAETLKLREMEYVQAAHALGVKKAMILIRHILPNVLHIILISVVLDFSSLVLAEAVLSYINIGVDPTTYSWGNMINGARLELAREPIVWWSLTAAFIFMFALVLAANLFADTVQEAFDPREKAE